MSNLLRILYVDDSQYDRELVRDALAQEQDAFDVTEAVSRASFEKLLRSGEYDLVLSDFDIAGFRVCRYSMQCVFYIPIHDITTDRDVAAIVLSIISLAHSLKLTVIAEGVETEAQYKYLRERHCDEMQGYYFSHPLPVDEFTSLLRQGRSITLDKDTSTMLQTLLIVDDMPNILLSLNMLLRQDGYRILTTQTPAAAFELLALHKVQVILCDQSMPLMNGTEFLARVKDLYPDTIRIMLSGHAEFQTAIDAINRGAVYRFFTKPWNGRLLRENIRQAFRHHWLVYESEAIHRAAMAAGDAVKRLH
jgi:DNA-binding NtrC family response regulator